MDSLITNVLAGASGSVITGIIAYLFKDILLERIKNSIKHEYDLKLKDVEQKFELKLTKYKAEIDNDKYKFENAFVKQKELLEKMNTDLNDIYFSLVMFYGLSFNALESDRLINETIHKIIKAYSYLALVNIYLDDEIGAEIYKLVKYFFEHVNGIDKRSEEDYKRLADEITNDTTPKFNKISNLSKKYLLVSNESTFNNHKKV